MYSFAKVRKSLQLAVAVAIWDLYDILILCLFLFLFWGFRGFLGVSMGQRLRDVLLCPKLGTLLCFLREAAAVLPHGVRFIWKLFTPHFIQDSWVAPFILGVLSVACFYWVA